MNHWSQYWKISKAVNSFAEGTSASGYHGDVEKFWQAELADLADDAVIVDVGTGNGALAMLASEYGKANNKKWQVHGVDAAEINPVAALESKPEVAAKLQAIEFHSGVDMATLPFADQSVDCVISQFALEYADAPAAIKEALRVLKPGGKLVAMVHHKKSDLIKDSGRGVEIFNHILNKTPLFMQADLLLRLGAMQMQNMDFASWQKTQPFLAATKTVEWIMHIVGEEFKSDEDRVWLNDAFGRVIDVINTGRDEETAARAAEWLNMTYDMLQGHRLRLEDQLAAAQTEAGVKKLIKSAGKAAAEQSYSDFKTENELFAWTFKLVKGADS